MSRFYRIKLNDLCLTGDGTTSGTTSVAVDGTPVNLLFGGGGRVLEIKIETLEAAIYHAVVALINTAPANSTTINIVGSGDILNFEVPVKPFFQPPLFKAKDFSGGVQNYSVKFGFNLAAVSMQNEQV